MGLPLCRVGRDSRLEQGVQEWRATEGGSVLQKVIIDMGGTKINCPVQCYLIARETNMLQGIEEVSLRIQPMVVYSSKLF